MTEEEWRTTNNRGDALVACRTIATDRKLYLLSIAGIRLIDHPDSEYANALVACERAVDFEDPQLALIKVREAFPEWLLFLDNDPWQLAEDVAGDHWDRWAETDDCMPLIRDIFGNPFRPVAFEPAWRSETAVALAAGIYEDRAFERMPILADAMEEAGCDHADILTHCREPGVHVRGCWVVDLVLGKE